MFLYSFILEGRQTKQNPKPALVWTDKPNFLKSLFQYTE
jgi:hypothetical protein